jgi:glycosyltransferase involved in cell wall biosynthesis
MIVMTALPTEPIVLDRSSYLKRFNQTRKVLNEIERTGYYCNRNDFISDQSLPFFSVMIITYNHEDYISDAIDSILMQERDFSIEINVIDDASTDNTQSIVLDYKNKYPDIINCYFNDKNVGHVATQINTFRGFQTLRGKYFSLLEGDDYWTDKNKLKQQLEFLESNYNFVACAHNTQKIFDDGRPPEHFLPFKSFGRDIANIHDLIHMSGVYHLSSIVYRNIFGQTPPYCLADPYSCEVTINMVYGQYGDFFCIDKNMSGYRVHGQGEFSTRSPEEIWLFHIHGHRRFCFYLGPSKYLMFSSAIVKFSRYVLNSPKTGEVKNLNFLSYLIFIFHILFFGPLATITIFPQKLKKLRQHLSNTVLDMTAKTYVVLNNILPEIIKRAILKIEENYPLLRRLRWKWKTINKLS